MLYNPNKEKLPVRTAVCPSPFRCVPLQEVKIRWQSVFRWPGRSHCKYNILAPMSVVISGKTRTSGPPRAEAMVLSLANHILSRALTEGYWSFHSLSIERETLAHGSSEKWANSFWGFVHICIYIYRSHLVSQWLQVMLVFKNVKL